MPDRKWFVSASVQIACVFVCMYFRTYVCKLLFV